MHYKMQVPGPHTRLFGFSGSWVKPRKLYFNKHIGEFWAVDPWSYFKIYCRTRAVSLSQSSNTSQGSHFNLWLYRQENCLWSVKVPLCQRGTVIEFHLQPQVSLSYLPRLWWGCDPRVLAPSSGPHWERIEVRGEPGEVTESWVGPCPDNWKSHFSWCWFTHLSNKRI